MKRSLDTALTFFSALLLIPFVMVLTQKKETQLAFIDTKGRTITNLDKYCVPLWQTVFGGDNKSKDVALTVGDFSYGFAPIQFTNGTSTFIDKTGRPFPKRFAEVREFSEELAAVATGRDAEGRPTRFGFIKTDGAFVTGTVFEDCGDFSEGFAAVKLHGKWGYIDHSGKLIVNPEYEDGQPFSEGFAGVIKSGKFGFINTIGELVVKPKYDKVYPFSEGLAAVEITSKEPVHSVTRSYLDRTGRARLETTVVIPKLLSLDLSDSPFGARVGAHDSAPGNLNYPSFRNGLAPRRIGTKYGYIDKVGTVKIPAKYDYAFGFSEGYAVVYEDALGGRLGYINTKGTAITGLKFCTALSFSDGLALVREQGEFGYIGPSGLFEIEPNFTAAHSFKQGLARVGRTSTFP